MKIRRRFSLPPVRLSALLPVLLPVLLSVLLSVFFPVLVSVLCCPFECNAAPAGPGTVATAREAAPPVAVLKDEFGKTVGEADVGLVLRECEPPQMEWEFDADDLKKQISVITDYLNNYRERDPAVVHVGLAAFAGNQAPAVTLEDVKRTLTFISRTISEDRDAGRSSRLNDPVFRARHFRVFRWYPVKKVNGKYVSAGEQIRITRYAVFTIPGRLQRSDTFNCALYALPDDERGLTLEQAAQRRERLNRFRHTKRQVLAGAYDRGGAEPLVWLTRAGLEEALMEGSICVVLPGGQKRFYNVDRNNGIPYDRNLKDPREQERYWYFAAVTQPRGYGMDAASQVPIFPHCALAGDIYNMGLGKLLGMATTDAETKTKKCRLAILADTGGAFTPNLRQLDYYAGVFDNREQFNRCTRHLPHRTEIYLFVKKEN